MLSEMMRSKIGRPKRSKIASKSTNLKSLEEADYRDRHYPKKTQIHHLRIREKKIFVAFTIEAYFLCSLNRLTIGVGLLLSLIHLFDMLATLHLLCSVPPICMYHIGTQFWIVATCLDTLCTILSEWHEEWWNALTKLYSERNESENRSDLECRRSLLPLFNSCTSRLTFRHWRKYAKKKKVWLWIGGQHWQRFVPFQETTQLMLLLSNWTKYVL